MQRVEGGWFPVVNSYVTLGPTTYWVVGLTLHWPTTLTVPSSFCSPKSLYPFPASPETCLFPEPSLTLGSLQTFNSRIKEIFTIQSDPGRKTDWKCRSERRTGCHPRVHGVQFSIRPYVGVNHTPSVRGIGATDLVTSQCLSERSSVRVSSQTPN